MWFRSVLDSLQSRSSRTPLRQSSRRSARSRFAARRFNLEPLENRSLLSAATPSIAIGDIDPMTALHDHALVASQESSVTGPEANGNVISAFARDGHGVRVIWGESTIVDGSRIATWALVSPHDSTILAVGATFSLKLAEEMPEPGTGPAHAIASLDFPGLVQETTYFNHLEIQSNPLGHDTPRGSTNPVRNSVPHFDFHFYSIPEEQVWAIPAALPPLPAVAADRLPPGYIQPGPSILEMGGHSAPVWSLTDPDFLSTIMILGYLPDGSQMHFLEPMISQEILLGGQDFTLPVPVPQTFGQEMLYATQFEAIFQGDAYSFVYSEFVTIPMAASEVNHVAATAPIATTNRTAPAVTDFTKFALLWVDAPRAGASLSAFDALAPVTVEFATANGTARPSDNDYVARSGKLIDDDQGLGLILNDDGVRRSSAWQDQIASASAVDAAIEDLMTPGRKKRGR